MKTKLFFDYGNSAHGKGEDFLIHVLFDSGVQSVNAIEGTVLIDPSLEVREVRDGDSILKFWVEAPVASGTSVRFSGITPGGVQTSSGKLFSLLVNAKDVGQIELRARDIRVLKNDGNASQIEGIVERARINISNEVKSDVEGVQDIDPPETFTPLVSKEPSMFEGKYFIAFSTQDKGSGIKEYKIKEGFFGDFVPAQSPHELSDQHLYKTIYVKAIDKGGNERVVRVEAEHLSPLEYGGWIFVFICMVLLGRKIWKRNSLKY